MSSPKALTAALIALLVFVVTASTPAYATSSWMVNKAELSGSAALATTAKKVENVKLIFSAVTVECSGENVAYVSPQIEGVNKGSSLSLTFSGCKATSKNCSLASSMKEKVGTLPLAEESTLEGSSREKVESRVSPKTGSIFATLAFAGANCSLAEEVQPVSGKGKLEAPTGQVENTLQEIKASITEASKELKVGSASASIAGAVNAKLANSNTWSLL